MATPNTNRIEVDLKLLQDRNLDRLHEFAGTFEKSVDRLVTAIGRMSEVVAQESPDSGATRAPLDHRAGQPARIGPGQPFSNLPYNAGVGYEGEASVASTQTPDQIRATQIQAEKHDIMDAPIEQNPYLQAQFELGQVGEGPLAMLRYTSRAMQLAGQRFGSEGLFNRGTELEHLAKGITIGKGAVTGIYTNFARPLGLPEIGSFTPGGSIRAQQFGINSGASADNGGPLGFLSGIPVIGGIANLLSPAGMGGIAADWKAAIESSFGFGSDITREQAKEIEETLNRYGYMDKGLQPQEDYLRSMMLKYTKKYRGAVTPEEMMSLGGDSAMRYGISSLNTLDQVLKNLGHNATDAGYSVDVFKTSLIQAVQDLQATMPATTAAQFASNWSRATGQLPEQAAQIASSYQNQLVGMAVTHTDPFALGHGPKAGTAAMMGFQALQGVMGNPAVYKGIVKPKGGVPHTAAEKRYVALYDQIYWRNGGKPPEGFESIDKYMNYMMTGGEQHVVKVNQAMSALTHAHSAPEIEKWMRHGGASPARIKEFEKERTDLLKHYGGHVPTDPKKLAKFLHDEKLDALKLMHQSIQKSHTKVATQNTKNQLDLTPRAAELVKLMNKQTDKGHTNSGKSFGRKALNAAEHGATVGGSILGPPGALAGGLIGGAEGAIAGAFG